MESKKVVFFNRLSFGLLLATIFLSLFFFVPYVPITLEASKGFLLAIGITLSIFFWFIARLGEGTFKIPRDRLLFFGSLIPLAFLGASLFSSSKYVSLFGSGFETGTFGSMLILFVLFFLSSMYFQSEKRLRAFYTSLFIGAAILALFEVVNIFIGFGRFVSIFQGVTSGNLVGSWNNFGLLFGLIVLLSIFTIEFTRTHGLLRVLHYFLLITGLFFLIIINTPLVWLLVGAFSIIIFVYIISLHHSGAQAVAPGTKKKFPFMALAVVFISLIFLIGNNFIGSLVSRYVAISNPDVRPSIVATSKIALQAIKHNPFFGTGPNTFGIDWSAWKPKAISQTDFWNVDFLSGFSPLLTFAVTTGILGFAACLLFLVTFFNRSVLSLKIALSQKSLTSYFIAMTLLVSTYSWVVFIVYTPNIIMLSLAFASSGILISILVHSSVVRIKEFSYLNGDPRNSFFSILGLMVLMIATLSITYVYIEKFASTIYFSRGLNAGSTLESLSTSERMLSSAATLDKNDAYYRALSQVYINKIGVLISDKKISEDILKSNVQQLVNLAEGAAGQAVAQNPSQYLNYVNLGNVYGSLVPLSVPKSYEAAAAAYNKARDLNPADPSILLSMAQLEFAHKSNDAARKFITQALALRPTYTDAIFFLAQIDMSEGDTPGAIKQAEQAGRLTPNDPTIFFRLGLLRYNSSNYADAVSAFEQAVVLNKNYLIARYFLGQAYQKVGRASDALVQYKILQKILPDNADIKNAINSVSNPTAPVASDTNTATDTPAKPTTKPQSKTPAKPATILPKQ